ncbi:hypothetical protein LAZ67_10001413 [Cordylochernes scorpioides]|uniref:Transposase n=1 Tax=Cordylochernes scorpioides TaxID=51811 RepID=A0ABY6KYL7_9ARAC|nr:hypothetical protein LAZ67_10001413 [Cordylochernes scorpioides]
MQDSTYNSFKITDQKAVCQMGAATKMVCGQRFSSSLLSLITLNNKNIRRHLVTVDETWIHHYTPESKQQPKQWTDPGERAPKKSNNAWSAEKVTRLLKKPVKTSEIDLEKCVFPQDNTLSHRYNIEVAKLWELGFQLVPNPSYSQDLAPCGFGHHIIINSLHYDEENGISPSQNEFAKYKCDQSAMETLERKHHKRQKDPPNLKDHYLILTAERHRKMTAIHFSNEI